MTEAAIVGLTDQEFRCIRLACEYLSSDGSSWTLADGPTLDSLHPMEPTPEVIVSDGLRTAAIEVKRLTGEAGYQTYKESLLSLRRALAPSCGGDYFLSGPVNFHLPMEGRLRRILAREIERVAPRLEVGDKAALKVERQGYIVFREWDGQRYAHCLHNYGQEVLRPLTQFIEGAVFLIDEGLEHSFVTDEGRAAFTDVLRSAYEDKRFGIVNPLRWFEEWELIKNGDHDPTKPEEDQVWMIAVTPARSVYASVEECMDTMMGKALAKFSGKRWADLHVIVLEVQTSLMKPERSVPVIQGIDPNDLADVDLILLVNEEETTAALDKR
jgi:hypothetical protein